MTENERCISLSHNVFKIDVCIHAFNLIKNNQGLVPSIKLNITEWGNSVKCRWSYGSYNLRIIYMCFISVPKFVKISLTIYKQ